MKWSIALPGHEGSFTGGRSWRLGGMSDQCSARMGRMSRLNSTDRASGAAAAVFEPASAAAAKATRKRCKPAAYLMLMSPLAAGGHAGGWVYPKSEQDPPREQEPAALTE